VDGEIVTALPVMQEVLVVLVVMFGRAVDERKRREQEKNFSLNIY